MNRETWLNKLAERMAPRFEKLGFPLPKFRVAVGFTSAGKSKKVAGECWHSSKSGDGVFEILISPILDDSMDVAATLAHELIHAAVGFKHKHKGEFARVALALGLQRPMTATTAGEEFKAWAAPFLAKLGQLPHARLTWDEMRSPAPGAVNADEDGEGEDEGGGSSNAKPKQKTRLLKCVCSSCGYTVRTTAKWLEVGPPHCPLHGAMDTDGSDLPA